jgi:hypothetical protein
MTKILSVVWYKVLPPQYGGQKGTAIFNKYLGKNFPLVCLCSRDNPHSIELTYELLPELPVSKFQFINPFCWIKIFKTAKKEDISHIIIEHPYHGISGWLVKKFLGIKLVVHSHNIESQRFKEQGKWWWWILQILERRTHQIADFNFFKTEANMSMAIQKFNLEQKKCVEIPFGIEDYISMTDSTIKNLIYRRHSINPTQKLFLFAGTLDYDPNAKAVEAFYKEIAPRLDTELKGEYKIIICGRNRFKKFQYLKNLKHQNIIYAGEVEDIENYFHAADVFINPVRTSNGVQTKIIEAIKYGLNTVVFKSQLKGINKDVIGNKIFSARDNDWNQFHEKIIQSLAISFSTTDAFFNLYSWENIMAEIIKKKIF